MSEKQKKIKLLNEFGFYWSENQKCFFNSLIIKMITKEMVEMTKIEAFGVMINNIIKK